MARAKAYQGDSNPNGTLKTALSHSDENHIWIRGQEMTSLMATASFTDTVFLLHQGRLPSADERRLLDAILIAVCDHGPGSPSAATSRLVASANRQSPEAAVAAGVLAIGDIHAGAGLACMHLIQAGIDRAQSESISIVEAARRAVEDAIQKKTRLPGLGHRVHTQDPRTKVLFDMARDCKVAGAGIEFVTAVETAAREKIKPLPINVDGALAAVLYDMRFPPLRKTHLHCRPRRGLDGSGHRGVHARTPYADQVSRDL